MSTEDVQPQGNIDEQEPQGTTSDEPQGQEDPISLEVLQEKVAKVTAESRKWEQRAKADRAALNELKAKLDAMVSPEVVQDKDAQLEAEKAARAAAEREALRIRIAADKGIPTRLASLLVGDNEDEITATADLILEEIKSSKPKAQAARDGQNATPPKEQLTGAQLLKAAALG